MKKTPIFLISAVLCLAISAAAAAAQEDVDPGLVVNNPRPGAVFHPRQDIPVIVTFGLMNRFPISKLTVSLIAGSEVLATQDIMEPSQQNNVTLKVPAGQRACAAFISARAWPKPQFRFTGRDVGRVDVSLDRYDLEMNVVAPPTVPARGTIDATVRWNPQANPGVDKLIVTMGVDNMNIARLERREFPCAGSSFTTSFRVPADLTGRDVVIQAEPYPDNNVRQVAGRAEAKVTIARIVANVRIGSPQPMQTVQAGQTLPVTITMNPDAVGVVSSLEARLQYQSPRADIETKSIPSPQAANSVQFQIPVEASGKPLLVVAEAGPAYLIESAGDSKMIQVAHAEVNLAIAAPSEGEVYAPGMKIPVTVTMNGSAAGAVHRIDVRLLRGGAPLAEIPIERPMFSNRLELGVPSGVAPGEMLTIEAAASPQEALNGGRAQRNIRINRPDAGLSIVSPRAGMTLANLKAFDVTVSLNPEAAGAADRLVLVIRRGGTILFRTEKFKPGPNSVISVTGLPPDTSGELEIEAAVFPPDRFQNDRQTIRVQAKL